MNETVNKKYKDRLFKKVFEGKKHLLSLYNALNDTNYDNPDEIEVMTIEDYVYMSMKNDVSFLIYDVLNLYEHQSTINPNMPLRGFLYLSQQYKGMFGNHVDLYSSNLIPLPTPQFVVFYNGTKAEADERILRLSDSFTGKINGEPALECTARLLNINYGHNKKLLEKCQRLKEYSILIRMIREFLINGMTTEDAINKAIDYCIQKKILIDILEKHRAEVTDMLLTEYDENLHINNEKSISYEEGVNNTLDIISRLKAGESPEVIIASGVSSELVQRILESLN